MKTIAISRIVEECGFSVLAGEKGLDREVDKVFCCDLLSFVMGRAPADCAWVTVMGNVNAIAVAVLADAGCIVLAENAALDEDAKARADQQGVPVLASDKPVFETALMIHAGGEAPAGNTGAAGS